MTQERSHQSGRVAIKGLVPFRKGPDWSATIDSYMQFGEEIVVDRSIGDWMSCTVGFAGYSRSGYVQFSDIGVTSSTATHRVRAKWAPLFSYASARAQILDRLPWGSEVCIIGEEKSYYLLWPYGAVFKHLLEPITDLSANYMECMRSLLGIPFIWGGRTTLGLDCAGFLQLGLRMAGIPCPRHRTEIPHYFGVLPDGSHPMAGDIAVYSKHCAVFTSDERIMHASATFGEVIEEPLSDFMQRREEVGDTRFSHVRIK